MFAINGRSDVQTAASQRIDSLPRIKPRKLVKAVAWSAMAAGVLALAGQAHAADRGRRDHGSNRGGCDNRRSYDNRGGFRSGFGLSINLGDAFLGSRFCAPTYYAPGYCPPVYCAPTYCPPSPPRCDRPAYCPPRLGIGFSTGIGSTCIGGSFSAPLYNSNEVVIQQPTVVERVVERPVYIDRTVVVERPQAPVIESGRYQDRELGDAYLHVADFGNAARVYSRYLSAWSGDGTASRNLGLALIAQGNTSDGFRAVINGYRSEPALYSRPLTINDLGGTAGFQHVLDSAVRAADSSKTLDGWFTLAVLNTAAGNRDGAQIAATRARDAGLDTASLDSLTYLITH